MTVATESKRTFASGIHPPGNKGLAADAAIEVLPAPKSVMIPLVQHIGAPCEAAVKSRDDLSVGDVVGTAQGFVSAPVHATIDGAAGRAGAVTLPNARHVPAIPIKAADEQSLSGRELFDEMYGGDWPKDGLEQYEPEQIGKAVQAAGLVGLGGAAFPTHVKLAKNDEKPISTLLLNGAECEPYLTADYRLMLEAAAPIITGALLAQRATDADEVIICIEDNKPQAIETMRQAAAGTSIKVQPLETKYPQGGEKQLIAAVLDKEVPTGGLPLDIGAVVINVGTAAALARAVVRGKPLTHRIIAVSGAGIKQPKNILAPIGVSYQALVDFCGGVTDKAARILSGGPMMGFAMGNLETPVTKGASGITVLTPEEVAKAEESACVRCGRCVDGCPLRLVPTRLALAARAGNVALAERYYIAACMECGCCSYVCPASIPLVQLIRVGKIMVREANR